MKILRKRNKIMVALTAALCSITAVIPVGVSTSAAATKTKKGSVTIDKLKITRTIYEGQDVQGIVDECVGAAVYRSNPGVLQLAAHRTQCGSAGFRGVDTLQKNDKISVTFDGKTTKYRMIGEGVGDYEKALPAPPVGTQVTLMASYSKFKGDTRIYLKYFQPLGIPMPAGNGGRQVTQGKPVCAAVAGAKKNDWVFVNVTPVRGTGKGFTTVYPAGNKKIVPDPKKAPSTSTANWTSRAPSPNTTLVQAGDGGKVCAAVYGSAVDLIFDAVAIASSNKFSAAHRRLIDTRSPKRNVNNSSVCFAVPGAANKWAVLNLTAIGHGPGWGRLEVKGNTNNYSNVNYGKGDIDPNMVIIKVPSDGNLCYRSGGNSDAVVDLIAIAKSGTFLDPGWLPTRMKDLRKPPFYILQMNASAAGGRNKGWAFVNATPIPKGVGGFSTFYDCQLHPAIGSDVNYSNRADPNVAVVKTGPGSEMCIATTGDRPGWVIDMLAVAEANAFKTPNLRRILDTRS